MWVVLIRVTTFLYNVLADSDSAVISGVTISGTAVEGVRINNSTNVILQQSEVFQSMCGKTTFSVVCVDWN